MLVYIGRNEQARAFIISDHLTESYRTLIENMLSRHHEINISEMAKCVVVSHIKTISAHMCLFLSLMTSLR